MINQKIRWKKMSMAFLTGTLCLTLFAGCASFGQKTAEYESGSGKEAEGDVEAKGTVKADVEAEGAAETGTGSLGEFAMQDITGTTYTREMFQDYELTMINIFTTWCTPCINEIPDLEKLHGEMSGQGVNIVGIVLDAADGRGGTDEEAVEKAKLLAERTGASYPFLIPDAGGLNGRLHGIQAVPETFFVDKNGNLTGGTYTGSNSLEGWKQVIETELGNLKGENP